MASLHLKRKIWRNNNKIAPKQRCLSVTTFSHFHPIWLFKAELVAPGDLFLRPLDDHFPQAWVIIVTCSLRPGTPLNLLKHLQAA